MGGHSYAACICHHTVTQPSHAFSINAICLTKLTSCGERNMSREASAWWEHTMWSGPGEVEMQSSVWGKANRHVKVAWLLR